LFFPGKVERTADRGKHWELVTVEFLEDFSLEISGKTDEMSPISSIAQTLLIVPL
jgi:hypothetical protein